MASAPLEKIQGIVKTLTFFNEETGFFIAKITVDGKGERAISGATPAISVGEQLSATGSWQSTKWGPQFKAATVLLSVPTMHEGILSYLTNAINGVGKATAKKLLDAFGEQVFEIIEKNPEKLAEVEGIGRKRAAAVIASIDEHRAIRDIMLFLHKAGLSASRAHRVYAAYGASAVRRLKENPYILSRDLWGFGFSSADAVALKQGIPRDSEFRISAGIDHVLRTAEGGGSCGVPVAILKEAVCQLLNLPLVLIDDRLAEEVSAGTVVRDFSGSVDCIFSPRIYRAEKNIAERLVAHSRRTPVTVLEDVDGLIYGAELELGMQLEETQRSAVRTALLSNVCVITGGPGTGKTTITRVLLKIFDDCGLSDIVLSAPTGKAAQRASAATGYQASTIHRALGVKGDGKFEHGEDQPLECDIWASDESSMQDVSITNAMVKALSTASRFILIGDVNQIRSVGPGKVLADMIDSEVFPTVKLTQVFRQAANSDIIKNAYAVNSGEMPEMGFREGSDFCFLPITPTDPKNEDDKAACRTEIEQTVLQMARDMYKLGYDPIRDVQILAPMRKGVLGVISLNIALQRLLNPDPLCHVEVLGTEWRTGDKVMQRRNNYDKDVFNGDVGYIQEIHLDLKVIDVEYDNKTVRYTFADLDELTLAYAMTVHKSQGSEFPVVIIPIDWSHFQMLKRNILYTALTRARKLCVLVGQPAAVRTAVKSTDEDERYSKLKDFLQELASSASTEQEPALA